MGLPTTSDEHTSPGGVTGRELWAPTGPRSVGEVEVRLKDDGREWWADPYKRQAHEINHGDGGRGLYWDGPDGHWLEIITRPYGSGG